MDRLLEYTPLFVLVVFHVVNNWIYVSTRETILGLDWPSHLRLTLAYSDILQEINIRPVFEAVTRTAYRPPFPWLPAVPLYRLFGESDDVAVMTNCLFLAVLLLSAYGIGKEVHGRKAGLLSAFLVSTTPLLFNLSRMPYPDYPLAAMVACAINWLVRVDGFRHRGYSLLFGLSLGFGMLTKQPFVIFVGPPLAYVVVRSRALRDIKAAVRRGRESGSRLASIRDHPAAHVLAGLVITGLWYIPVRNYVGLFYLGHKLFFCYWLLVSATFYVLSRRPSKGANLLSAAALGTLVASVWYLPRIRSFRRVLKAAYSGQSVEGGSLSFSEVGTYARFLSSIISEQLGPLFFAALVLAVLFLGYWAVRQRRAAFPHSWLSDHAWIMALWFLVPYAFFTLSLTEHSRYLAPLLPPAAIITAVALGQIRSRVLSRVMTSCVFLAALIQFFALSFGELEWIRDRARFAVPVVGEVNLLAHGSFIQLPDLGPTDSDYFILPDLLEAIRADMVRDGRTEVRVALLMRASYLNDVTFSYLARARGYSGIRLSSKLKRGQTEPLYERTFASDYVVLWNTSSEPPTELGRLSLAILRETPSLFSEAFRLLQEHTVPNGDVIMLYEKEYYLGEGEDEEIYKALAERIQVVSRDSDAIILHPYEQVEVLGRYYSGQAQPYPLGADGLGDCARIATHLERITSQHGRVVALFGPQQQGACSRFAEQWLNEQHYRILHESHNGLELMVYETS